MFTGWSGPTREPRPLLNGRLFPGIFPEQGVVPDPGGHVGGRERAAGEITQLLIAWRNGDADAADRLFPLLYSDLRAIARRQIRRSGRGGTLETTSLVHEAYLRLVDQTRAELNDRNHFFAVASKTMRHILIDHARASAAQKRGGGDAGQPADLLKKDPLLDAGASADRAEEILAVNEALRKLEALDGRLAEIVELRFFGGLSVEEAGDVLGLSPRTVKRDWQKARAFLILQLSPEPA